MQCVLLLGCSFFYWYNQQKNLILNKGAIEKFWRARKEKPGLSPGIFLFGGNYLSAVGSDLDNLGGKTVCRALGLQPNLVREHYLRNGVMLLLAIGAHIDRGDLDPRSRSSLIGNPVYRKQCFFEIAFPLGKGINLAATYAADLLACPCV